MDSLGVVPVDPISSGRLYVGSVSPGGPASRMLGQLGFVQPDRESHQGVAKSAPDTSDRAGNARLFQRLGERQRRILRPRVGMVNQPGRGELRVLPATGGQS